jgi:hypothetical protein
MRQAPPVMVRAFGFSMITVGSDAARAPTAAARKMTVIQICDVI